VSGDGDEGGDGYSPLGDFDGDDKPGTRGFEHDGDGDGDDDGTGDNGDRDR
jgi:hypothetical protein